MTTQNQQQSFEQVPITLVLAIENSAHCGSVSNGRCAGNAGVVGGGGASESDGVDSRETSVSSSSSGCSGDGVSTSGSVDRGLGRANTVPTEITSANCQESPASRTHLERSISESPRDGNSHSDDAAKMLDDKISERKKMKILKRIATVHMDGTVGFEVRSSLQPSACHLVPEDFYAEPVDEEPVDFSDRPPMQIVVLIVGTRGDVQLFIPIGKRLQDYGHRIRLATHSNFKEFVLTSGLEFFPLGGDPKVLAEYMVKNKGFLPSGPSEVAGQRQQIREIIYSLLPACEDADDSGIPFKAEAIIANPRAYGHTFVAEALKIPLHVFFTMPWMPTSAFPHPLSRVNQSAACRVAIISNC